MSTGQAVVIVVGVLVGPDWEPPASGPAQALRAATGSAPASSNVVIRRRAGVARDMPSTSSWWEGLAWRSARGQAVAGTSERSGARATTGQAARWVSDSSTVSG